MLRPSFLLFLLAITVVSAFGEEKNGYIEKSQLWHMEQLKLHCHSAWVQCVQSNCEPFNIFFVQKGEEYEMYARFDEDVPQSCSANNASVNEELQKLADYGRHVMFYSSNKPPGYLITQASSATFCLSNGTLSVRRPSQPLSNATVSREKDLETCRMPSEHTHIGPHSEEVKNLIEKDVVHQCKRWNWMLNQHEQVSRSYMSPYRFVESNNGRQDEKQQTTITWRCEKESIEKKHKFDESGNMFKMYGRKTDEINSEAHQESSLHDIETCSSTWQIHKHITVQLDTLVSNILWIDHSRVSGTCQTFRYVLNLRLKRYEGLYQLHTQFLYTSARGTSSTAAYRSTCWSYKKSLVCNIAQTFLQREENYNHVVEVSGVITILYTLGENESLKVLLDEWFCSTDMELKICDGTMATQNDINDEIIKISYNYGQCVANIRPAMTVTIMDEVLFRRILTMVECVFAIFGLCILIGACQMMRQPSQEEEPTTKVYSKAFTDAGDVSTHTEQIKKIFEPDGAKLLLAKLESDESGHLLFKRKVVKTKEGIPFVSCKTLLGTVVYYGLADEVNREKVVHNLIIEENVGAVIFLPECDEQVEYFMNSLPVHGTFGCLKPEILRKEVEEFPKITRYFCEVKRYCCSRKLLTVFVVKGFSTNNCASMTTSEMLLPSMMFDSLCDLKGQQQGGVLVLAKRPEDAALCFGAIIGCEMWTKERTISLFACALFSKALVPKAFTNYDALKFLRVLDYCLWGMLCILNTADHLLYSPRVPAHLLYSMLLRTTRIVSGFPADVVRPIMFGRVFNPDSVPQ